MTCSWRGAGRSPPQSQHPLSRCHAISAALGRAAPTVPSDGLRWSEPGTSSRRITRRPRSTTTGRSFVAAEITVDAPDFGHLEPMFHATLRELANVGVHEPPEVGDRGHRLVDTAAKQMGRTAERSPADSRTARSRRSPRARGFRGLVPPFPDRHNPRRQTRDLTPGVARTRTGAP